MMSFDLHMQYATSGDPAVWEKLNTAKTTLDAHFMSTPKNARQLISLFDPFRQLKNNVDRILTYKPTRAWMKCRELDMYFNLVHDDTFVWDNCSFPGMFVLAHNHISAEKFNHRIEWVASSLLGTTTALGDAYGLFTNNREKWLMHENNDGNVTVATNLVDFKQRLDNKISLYTSDLGMDIGDNYNNQEVLHLDAHFGQALAGIMVLRLGGDFVAKMFTFAHPRTQGLIGLLSGLFAEFYIAKPATSAITNSEIYLVGKGFRGLSPDQETRLLAFDTHPIEISPQTKKTLEYIATQIYGKQISALHAFSGIAERYRDLDLSNHRNKKMITDAISRGYYHATLHTQTCVVDDWYTTYNITRIDPSLGIVTASPVSSRQWR